MATYFGEVLPVSSRVVDDEDDLEAELQGDDVRNGRMSDDSVANSSVCASIEVILRWSPGIKKEMIETNGFLRHNHLIFVIGHIPIAFIRRFLLSQKAKPIGVISCGLDATDKNSASQVALDDTSCFLYEIPLTDGKAGIICTWNLKATPFQEILAVDRLFTNIGAQTEITVLSSSPAINYKHENIDESYENAFLKSLVTDSNNRNIPIPKLEVPNLLTGISAAVMSHCQVYGLFASLYVCYYADDLRSDSDAVDVFRPLLNIAPLNKFQSLMTVTEEERPQTIRQFIDTNLYI